MVSVTAARLTLVVVVGAMATGKVSPTVIVVVVYETDRVEVTS